MKSEYITEVNQSYRIVDIVVEASTWPSWPLRFACHNYNTKDGFKLMSTMVA